MDSIEQRQRAWADYWDSGLPHSCPGSLDLDGDGLLAGFWRGLFDYLPAGALVVDLGTGNGELLRLAWEVAHGRVVKLHGIDLSRPSPHWFEPDTHGDSVRIHAATAMEQVPLADGCADLVMSQFGVEYAERGKVQAECLRLLRGGGKVALVIHHADSVIAAAARDELVAQDFLLARDGLIARSEALIPHVAAIRGGAAPKPAAHEARIAFNDVIERGGQLASSLKVPDLLNQVASVVQRSLSRVDPVNSSEVMRSLAALRQALLLAQTRTREQMECAMSPADLDAFMQPFVEAGMQVAVRPLEESGRLLAWIAEAMPAAEADQRLASSVASP